MSDIQGSGAAEAPAPGTLASALGPAPTLQPLKVGPLTIGPQQPGAAATSGQSAPATTGNTIIDQIVTHITDIGEQLIADLTYAEALASYVDPSTGAAADPNGAQALAAIIPLVTLVVQGPPAAASGGTAPTVPKLPHVVTDLQKARIVLLRFQDPKFLAALAPLAQDIQQQLGSLLGVAGVVAKVLGMAAVG